MSFCNEILGWTQKYTKRLGTYATGLRVIVTMHDNAQIPNTGERT